MSVSITHHLNDQSYITAQLCFELFNSRPFLQMEADPVEHASEDSDPLLNKRKHASPNAYWPFLLSCNSTTTYCGM